MRRHSHSVLFHLNLDRLFKVFDLQLPIASSHIRISASCGIFEQTVSTAARRSTAASTQSCQPVSRPVPSSLLTEGTCPKYTWGITTALEAKTRQRRIGRDREEPVPGCRLALVQGLPLTYVTVLVSGAILGTTLKALCKKVS